MTEELIKRLRDDDTDPVMLKKAADTIEIQAAEIKRLQDALRNAAEIVLGAGYPLVAEHMRQIAGETE